MEDKYYFLNSLNTGILLLNEKKEIVFINNWLLIKLPKQSKIKKGNILNVDESKYGRFCSSLEETIKFGQSSLLTSQLNQMPIELYHGKTPLSYNLSISKLSKESHKGSGILLQFTDVTQVKEREKYLKDKQKEIDEQKEKVFYQERLSALGELTSSIAHEINNPLAILEMGHKTLKKMLVKKNICDKDLEEVIEEGEETIKRVTELIKSVRDLSDNQSLKELSRGRISEILHSATIVFTEKSKLHNVELKIDLKKEIFNTEIELNRPLLIQAFANLLNNSFHAIESLNEKWIEIDGRIEENHIIIYITDSGAGISKDIQEKMFIPFFTTKDIGEGTGLGLSTTFKIIAGHFGEIRIDNECANTRFEVKLPKLDPS